MSKKTFWSTPVSFSIRSLTLSLIGIFVLAGIASGVFINHIFPLLTNVPGFRLFAPRFTVVVNRTDEVRIIDGIETRELYDRLRASTVTVMSYSGAMNPFSSNFTSPTIGSGVTVTSDGLIFTSKGIIGSPTNTVHVVLNNGEIAPAEVLVFDSGSDLAIIRVQAQGLPVIDFGNAAERLVGDKVVAVGSSVVPFRNPLWVASISSRVGTGSEYSAVRSSLEIGEYAQLTPSVEESFLGSPVIDTSNRILGMITPRGLLPGEYLRASLNNYLADGVLQQPLLNLQYRMVTPALAATLGMPNEYGALVISSSGPAARLLRAGDLVVSLNGRSFSEQVSFEQVLRAIMPGTEGIVEFYRDNSLQVVQLDI